MLSSALGFVKRTFSTAAGQRRVWRRSELRIARGAVADQLNGGLVLHCTGWVVGSATGGYVYAGDGRGMNSLYANRLNAYERLHYGRLMTVDNGTMRESIYQRDMWTPESYLNGPVLLRNYPPGSPGRGKGLKVVVAPDGNATWKGQTIPACTATFTLAD